MSPRLPLLAGLLCLAPLLAASPAAATTYDAFGGVTSSGTGVGGTGRCRGVKIRADEDTVISRVGLWAANSDSGTSTPEILEYYVFESTTLNGTYTKVAETFRNGDNGSAPSWEWSHGMGVPVSAGRYYNAVACWTTSLRYYWGGSVATTGDVADWGTVQGSLVSTVANQGNTWSGGNASTGYRVAVETQPRDVAAAGANFTSTSGNLNPAFRGGWYTVNTDTTLRSFEQKLTPNPSLQLPVSVNWYVFERQGGTGNMTEVATGSSTIEAREYVGSGSTVPTASWVRSEDMNVALKAGYEYAIGFAWSAAISYNWRSNTTPNIPWGAKRGTVGVNANPPYTAGTTSLASTGLNASSAAVSQRLYTADRDPEGLAGSTGYPYTDRGVGTIWNLTGANATATVVQEYSSDMDPTVDGELTFMVGRSATSHGAYTTLLERRIRVEASDPRGMVDSGPLDLTLEPGWYYTFAFYNDGIATTNYYSSGAQAPPGNFTWGTRYGYRFCPGTCTAQGASTLPGTSYANNAFGYEIVTCDDCVDLDGDGVTLATDCDDTNPAVFPGATETCDLVDNNCNSLVDEGFDADQDGETTCGGDCDDTDPNVNTSATEVCNTVDDDCDGVKDDGFDIDSDGVTTCGDDGVVGTADDDCNDTNATVYPATSGSSAAPELCDALDNDCDAAIDELFDNDADGYTTCGADGQAGTTDDDCNDSNNAINPGATEACNNADDDCDGSTDEGFDADSDTYLSAALCGALGTDCNDNNPFINPGATEACNAIDDNCDGTVPANESDSDGDGQLICQGDCNDTNASIYNNAPELCDGRDNDCDGVFSNGTAGTPNELDVDGDTYFVCTYVTVGGNPNYGGGDCNDNAANVNPGAPELCDGIDNNCNGTVADEGTDSDGDGVNTCTDCNDADANVFPGAPEICDGRDSDCDGATPPTEVDGDADSYIPCALAGGANPPAGILGGDCLDTNAAIHPGATEVCDGYDTDCAGGVPATEADTDNDGYLACTPYVENGLNFTGGGDCDGSDATQYPGATESCNGADDDCDGTVDEGFDADADGFSSAALCPGVAGATDCDDTNAAINTSATELCDSVDNDCDSAIDEGFDADNDGFMSSALCTGVAGATDCDDTNAAINTSATEVCDAVDNDCDSAIDEGFDGDGDGYLEATACAAVGGNDCDDTNAAINIAATEACDGVDNDCDASVDEGFDADNDGFNSTALCPGVAGATDCNDNNPFINPNAAEVCNAIDDDCDGTIPNGPGTGEIDDDADGFAECNGDCDDTDITTYTGASELCDTIDNDCDGTVDEGFDADNDTYFDSAACPTGTDCDDSDPTVNPAATEVCDQVDNNCDQTIDEGFDADNDLYPTAADANCVAAYGTNVDCNDADNTIHPFATEVCDTVDQDCDGAVDETFDVDGDSWFDGSVAGCVTAYPAGVDCDDTNAAAYPAAPELCDAVDNDCDSNIDEIFDGDNDGWFDGSVPACVTAYPAGVDCDDTEPTAFPGNPEVCDGVDNDCSGTVPGTETDGDGDGYVECPAPLHVPGFGGDCDDAVASVFPGAPEFCNAVDDDCDGPIDEDFDGDNDGAFNAANPGCVATYGAAADCLDSDPAVNPSAAEVCDGDDEDCDGVIDNGFDLDNDGFTTCAGDCDDTAPLVFPGQVENCTNGIDDNCDGTIDQNTDGDGDGVTVCDGDCNDNDTTVFPGAPETCDAVDNDCDLAVDEDFDVDADGYYDDTIAACVTAWAAGQLDCDDSAAAINPSASEICDTVDDDCDGAVDEDFDLDGDTFFTAANPGCVGAYASTDCDDAAPSVYPGQTEICDAVDNDCDVDIDEDFDVDGDTYFTGADAGCVANYGADVDCDDAVDTTYPEAPELCNGVDDACSGAIPGAEIDDDLDGFVECSSPTHNNGMGDDCDDTEIDVFPGQTELCNNVDDDCDGLADEDFDGDGDGFVDGSNAACEVNYEGDLDCDDTDPAVSPGTVEVCDGVDQDCDLDIDEDFDGDGDGYFDGDDAGCAAQYANPDCDDSDPAIFPFNFEICPNGADDNCNGLVDEDIDDDGDGFSTCAGDCNDEDAAVYLGAPEDCDLVDQDCDFLIDEDFDADGDTYIDGNDAGCQAAYAGLILDCDDTDPQVNAEGTETCDGEDEDCDGSVDEPFDLDGDSYFDRFAAGCVDEYGGENTDCDDESPSINPGATELCDGEDNDCDTFVDEDFDADGDGVWDATDDCRTTYGDDLDCNDLDAAVYPAFDGADAAPEICDGEDNDCDGVVPEDADGDTFPDAEYEGCADAFDPSELDCRDDDPAIHPEADEICDDGVDNDCDMLIDAADDVCEEGTVTTDPVRVEPGDTAPPLVEACAGVDCGSYTGRPSGGAWMAVGLVALIGLRRRRRRSGPPRAAAALLVGSLALVALPSASVAQDAFAEEAQRQIDFAWKELSEEKYESAIKSADSALRLNPALYTAMVIKALAYEGLGEHRKAESWLTTYLDLTSNLSQAPEALALQERLTSKSTRAVSIASSSDTKAFGDGFFFAGGLVGVRNFEQSPCAAGEGCEAADESRPGFWSVGSTGVQGGLSIRAEYFPAKWLLGPRVRYDIGAGAPVDTYDVERAAGPDHRLDAGVVFRPPLVKGATTVRLMADVGYGLRTWEVYENLNATDYTSFDMVSHHLGAGIGVRVEPGSVIGIDARFGIAGLLGAAPGINDYGVTAGVAIRPVDRLLIQVGFDLRADSYSPVRTNDAGDTVAKADVLDLTAGAYVGAGVAF